MPSAIEDLIGAEVEVATIPSTLADVQKVVRDPDSSGAELVAVVQKDPAIVANVLRLANSSFYALREPLHSIEVAAIILGFRTVENLVLQAAVVDRFSFGPAVDGFDPAKLWDHSFKAAVAARLLYGLRPFAFALTADEAYTSGLLHDIGKMVLLQSRPADFGRALQLSAQRQISLVQAEREVFGFTDGQVCALLAQRWHLGSGFEAAVLRQCSSDHAPEQRAAGRLAHVASTLAHDAARSTRGWIPDRADEDVFVEVGASGPELARIVATVADAVPPR